ncbi:hypothetical protein ACOMHN_022588 [Nucella lapillus]
MYYCCLGLLAVMVVGLSAADSCYVFMGDSYLKFATSSLNISGSVKYTLKFRTTEPSGILLYSEGPDDYEGLYVYQGKLVYLLTNPAPTGVEGTIGGHYQGNIVVNDGAWYMVELMRNWESEKQAPQVDSEMQTGIILYDEAGVKMDTVIDHFNHRGVVLFSKIYVGGISASVVYAQESHVPPFTGQIKDMRKEGSGFNFTSYNVNYEVKVKPCS